MFLSRMQRVKTVNPSTAVSEPVEIDVVRLSIGIMVCDFVEVGDSHDLSGRDCLARAFARVCRGAPNTDTRAVVIVAEKSGGGGKIQAVRLEQG